MNCRFWSLHFLLGSCIALLAGCAQRGPAPLYLWETFPRQQYDALLHEGASPEEQIRLLESHAEKARGASAALPPGFRAHLGMLHLNAGHVDQARDLWTAEKTAFPESAAYIDQLLKRLSAPAMATKGENPA
jgi:hypothetical protein